MSIQSTGPQQVGEEWPAGPAPGGQQHDHRRWKRNPKLNFPSSSEVNGIEYTNLDTIDEWMKAAPGSAPQRQQVMWQITIQASDADAVVALLRLLKEAGIEHISVCRMQKKSPAQK